MGQGDKMQEEADDRQPLVHDAVEWFVENESDTEPRRALLLRWELWFRHPKNRSDYAGVIQMREQIRRLPPPRQPPVVRRFSTPTDP